MDARGAAALDDARILLASGSPRRQELLSQMELEFDVVPPKLDESEFDEQTAEALVRALAAAKAEAVRQRTSGAEGRWILAADTVVVVNGSILGKPDSRDEAEAMIRSLAGRTHRVVTGIAVWPPDGQTPRANDRPAVEMLSTDVCFCEMTDAEVRSYLDSEDWHDVAGGYRIQGRAARHIEWISGSYSNVVGLPIHLVYSILTAHGYPGLGLLA